jgi:hypothetical protein
MSEPTMGEMASWTFYQRVIAEHVKDIEPRHVESWMRLSHPTLYCLSRSEFLAAKYLTLALAQHAAVTESEALAASFDL